MDNDALARVSLDELNAWIAERQAAARDANHEAAECAYDIARGYRELKVRLTKRRLPQEEQPGPRV